MKDFTIWAQEHLEKTIVRKHISLLNLQMWIKTLPPEMQSICIQYYYYMQDMVYMV